MSVHALLFMLSLPFTAPVSHAYIPEYATIISHAAGQHGKGAYRVEQEVTYQKESEAYTVKETWTVLDENNLRLSLEGRGPLKGLVGGTVLYQGKEKEFVDAGGNGSRNVRTQRLGDNWLEPLFYFRSSHYLRNRLASLHLVPEESLHDRAPLNANGPPNWQAQNFVRLSRSGGVVTWAIGVNPAGGSTASPGLWLEQDQFLVRKYKGADQSVIRADDYAKYHDGFWFPRQRNYNFAGYTVQIQTLQVKTLGKLTASDPRFHASSLNSTRDALRLPEPVGLKEFYARFR